MAAQATSGQATSGANDPQNAVPTQGIGNTMRGTNLVNSRPALNITSALDSSIGGANLGKANFNDSNMALTTSIGFTTAVISALSETPISQDGLGVFGGNDVPNNAYLEHITANYGRAGMAYCIERGFTAANQSKLAGSDNFNVVLVPLKNEYTVVQATAQSKGGAVTGNIPLSYSGFSATSLTANLVSETNPQIAIGTNPKVFIQKYQLSTDSSQVVYVIYIGALVISEMFRGLMSGVIENTSAINFANFDHVVRNRKGPLATALNSLLGAKDCRVIYVQDSNGHWGDPPAGGPLLNWMPGTVYSTQTEATFLMQSATPFSSFNTINTKSQRHRAASWMLYPIIQALVFEGIFNSKSDWMDKFFKNNSAYAGLGKILFDTYQMASSFGSNKSQKSVLSEIAKGIANAIKSDFTRTNAAPSSARGHLVNYLNTIGASASVGIRI